MLHVDDSDIATNVTDIATPTVIDPAYRRGRRRDGRDRNRYGAKAQDAPRSTNRWNDFKVAIAH